MRGEGLRKHPIMRLHMVRNLQKLALVANILHGMNVSLPMDGFFRNTGGHFWVTMKIVADGLITTGE